MVWNFDLSVTTHDLLKEGVIVERWIHIIIWAETWLEASLLAIHMAWRHGYVTECLTCI